MPINNTSINQQVNVSFTQPFGASRLCLLGFSINALMSAFSYKTAHKQDAIDTADVHL